MSRGDNDATKAAQRSIKPIDKTSIHRITSGQVVIDLQTAVKELVENSLDAGATNLEVRFKQYGLSSIEVIDNGCGIAEEDHESIGLKHHTSKIAAFSDLAAIHTFGFRGEALSSLCALCQSVQVTTSTNPPKGVCLELEASGRVKSRKTVARPKGTTVTLTGLFLPLPVRRKELERNIKREFAKALGLLNAYALIPCAAPPGARLIVSNQPDKGARSQLISTEGSPSIRASVTSLWGPKSLDNIVDLDLEIDIERERHGRRITNVQGLEPVSDEPLKVQVKGLISKFTIGCGRTGTDRQFFYVNGRPCTLNKIQKTFNEVYRSFNANQSPFVIANFVIPTDACDVNVSPDKRTIFLHSETNMISALKTALEHQFNPARSIFDVTSTQRTPPQPSPQAPVRAKVTVTNNTARLNRAVAPSDNEIPEPPASTNTPIVDIPDVTESSPTSSYTSGKSHQTNITDPTGVKVPLFIPDPDDQDDETEQTAGSADDGKAEDAEPNHVSLEAGDSEIILDTTRASWSRIPSSQNIDETNETNETRAQDTEAAADESQNSTTMHDENQPARKKPRLDLESDSLLSPPSVAPPTVYLIGSDTGFPSRRNIGPTSRLPSLQSKPHAPKGQGQTSIRKYLASFASNSQPQRHDSSESGEEEVTPMDDIPTLSYQDKESPSESEDHSCPHELEDIDKSSFVDSSSQGTSSSLPLTREPIYRPEVIRINASNDITLKFDLNKVTAHWHSLKQSKETRLTALTRDSRELEKLEDAGLSNTENEGKAEEVLSRIIDKKDFTTMDVVGQFNLGFIIARRNVTASNQHMDDLFIVDQHAADEKYNFETLQQTTNIQSQKLFKPRTLELTASDELTATENIDVLKKNGFEIDVDEAALSGSRLKLVAQPVSKSTVFDMRDLEELVNLMRDVPTGQMVRCSKARAMFAMRACRKSVMIGTALSHHQMLNVVRHMSKMEQPWNCPHGRPTMRHLADLTGVTREEKQVNWMRF